MVSVDIFEIFGTLSVAIFGVSTLLMAWWIYTVRSASFWTGVRGRFFLPSPDIWMLALLFPILLGFGVTVENITDHLTDSEKEYSKEAPCFGCIWYAIPKLQTYLLGSEGHHRFATLFKNCEQEETCKLGGLGKEYFHDHSDYLKRLAGNNNLHQCFVNNPIEFLQGKREATPRCNCKSPKKIATSFVNRVYYRAKNWAYQQETYYAELQSIQRYIEYARSSFLIASWGILFVWLAFLASAVRHWLNQPIGTYPWGLQFRRTSKLTILLVIIAVFGRMGYGHAENNFNERTLGYFGSHLDREKESSEECPPNGLRATQWLQTSAEYTALAMQAYNVAQRAVESRLDPATSDSRPPAVILDLDETVIDNSPFQVYLLKSGKTYNSDLWKSWVEDGASQATLIPGALSFIERMEALGVTVIYISNRRDSEGERAATIDTLKNLGVKIDGLSDRSTLRLLLKKDTSGKEARRQAVEQKYNILVLIGDALGDFAEVFDPVEETTIESRRLEALQAQEKWGSQWFVLPNPTYGAWQRILDEKAPFDQLRAWEQCCEGM